MKCVEYFYNQENAVKFLATIGRELEPEIIKTVDEDVNEDVWAVYYNPPKLRNSASSK